MNQHLPINLAVMGVKRYIAAPQVDLNIIWSTPYPIITTFKKVCKATGLDFLGKHGTMFRGEDIIAPEGGIRVGPPAFAFGEHSNGYILSGYRDEIINGNVSSMHRYAMALDVEVYSPDKQVDVAIEALKQGFTRVGLYPDRKFMHLDMAPDNWIKRFTKRRFWVEINGTKQSFDEIGRAIEFIIGT